MRGSIGARLVLFACLAMMVLLPIAGWMIAQAFERSVSSSFDGRIETYADSLAGLVERKPDGSIGFSREPRELRFEKVYSGWYWQVRQGARVVRTSRSLWDASLQYSVPSSGARHWLDIQGPRKEMLRASVLSLHMAELSEPVELLVAAPSSEVHAEIASFNRLLVIALGSLAVMLVAVFALQIRWGLAPLRRMENDLQRVREGQISRVDHDLPSDLRGVAEVMNEVLAHQEDLIQRARSTAGNLAHALKTPLATMRLRVEPATVDSAALRRDLAQVQDIVDHHLTRAAAAGRAGGRFHRTDLRGAIQPVIDAVRGISRDRGVNIHLRFEGEVEVAVDPHDLQELVGNLLENAVKWAVSRVELSIAETANEVLLCVDDDGPGIPDHARPRAVDRGTQLDQRSQGSGLGLAIVRDIAALYRIDFQLGDSGAGGLRAVLTLPRSAARSSE